MDADRSPSGGHVHTVAAWQSSCVDSVTQPSPERVWRSGCGRCVGNAVRQPSGDGVRVRPHDAREGPREISAAVRRHGGGHGHARRRPRRRRRRRRRCGRRRRRGARQRVPLALHLRAQNQDASVDGQPSASCHRRRCRRRCRRRLLRRLWVGRGHRARRRAHVTVAARTARCPRVARAPTNRPAPALTSRPVRALLPSPTFPSAYLRDVRAAPPPPPRKRSESNGGHIARPHALRGH
jgi:hypothetical protein